MWFCPAFTGIMQNGYGKTGKNGGVYVLVPNMFIKEPNVTN